MSVRRVEAEADGRTESWRQVCLAFPPSRVGMHYFRALRLVGQALRASICRSARLKSLTWPAAPSGRRTMIRATLAVLAVLSAPISVLGKICPPKTSPGARSNAAPSRQIIWGMPAVNFKLMYQAMVRETKGGFNQIVYWSRLPDWKNQTLTPNPDTIYLMPFFDTKDGADRDRDTAGRRRGDQRHDHGCLAGPAGGCWTRRRDNGKGGKYLIVPPDYEANAGRRLHRPRRRSTHQGYALLRSILKSGSDADVAKAVSLWPAHQALPAGENRQAARDDIP